jgi:hypothetical protein
MNRTGAAGSRRQTSNLVKYYCFEAEGRMVKSCMKQITLTLQAISTLYNYATARKFVFLHIVLHNILNCRRLLIAKVTFRLKHTTRLFLAGFHQGTYNFEAAVQQLSAEINTIIAASTITGF